MPSHSPVARIRNLTPSPTLALDAHVKQLIAQGIDVINLGLGEPDFNTPSHIQQAAVDAMQQGFTHYTATAGIIELRKAVAKKLEAENSIVYKPEEIVIGVGSKQLLYNALMTLIEKGDEVLLPVPTWSTYEEQIKLAGGKSVHVPLKPPFKLTAKDLEKKLSSKTKLILLNSPSNPTGATIDPEELKKIAKLAVKHDLWIVSDEIYEKLLYEGEHISIASVNESVRERTITINGFSKAYAMTGWRIGYAAGPKEIIDGMVNLQTQTTSSTASIAQYAALAALNDSQTELVKMKNAFVKRRELVLSKLSTIKGISFSKPEGAFYVFFSVEKLLNKKYPTSADWAKALLETQLVSVVPGEAFFAPGYIRLSFAAAEDTLKIALQKIAIFSESL